MSAARMSRLRQTIGELAAREADMRRARLAGDSYSNAIAEFARKNRERAELELARLEDEAKRTCTAPSMALFPEDDDA